MGIKSKILILSGLVILLILVFVIIKWAGEPFMPDNETNVELSFNDINKKAFLRAKAWGITGNHQEIVLSEQQNTIANKLTDYIFYSSEVFYKVESNGLLLIYASKNYIEPKQNFSGIKVVLKDLENYDSIAYYNKNYQKLGLERISIYKNTIQSD